MLVVGVTSIHFLLRLVDLYFDFRVSLCEGERSQRINNITFDLARFNQVELKDSSAFRTEELELK